MGVPSEFFKQTEGVDPMKPPKPLSLHLIATRRRNHTFRTAERRSSIVQACADELAVIVDHRRSLVGD